MLEPPFFSHDKTFSLPNAAGLTRTERVTESIQAVGYTITTGANSSKGANVGVTYGAGAQNGLSIQLGMSQGKGKDNQNDTAYTATEISGSAAGAKANGVFVSPSTQSPEF